jgi:hypothetical protein
MIGQIFVKLKRNVTVSKTKKTKQGLSRTVHSAQLLLLASFRVVNKRARARPITSVGPPEYNINKYTCIWLVKIPKGGVFNHAYPISNVDIVLITSPVVSSSVVVPIDPQLEPRAAS